MWRERRLTRRLVVSVLALAAPALLAGETSPTTVGEVPGPLFLDRAVLAWEPVPHAQGYNIYLDKPDAPGTTFAGGCLYFAVPETLTRLDGAPALGARWQVEITALLPTGEGPMGLASDGTPRAPSAPCTCTLPTEVGPCDGSCPRWSYVVETGQCEPFVWGCCGGNANNFPSEAACAAVCLDPCALPPVVGPCDGIFPRWYFSVLTGKCEPFVWGGCGGNANRFETEEACATACP